MSTAPRQPMTIEAFLAWEGSQPARYEFDGVRPHAMTGGSAGHSRVQRNLIAELDGVYAVRHVNHSAVN